MNILKASVNPYISLTFNVIYALCNCIAGLLTHSWWFITVGSYYIVLSVTRFSVLLINSNTNAKYDIESFLCRTTGILLVLLSLCIVGVNVLSATKERGVSFNEIVMITIATYTFTKITISIIGMVKAHKTASTALITLRNISLSDACVSIYTMQRSMLATFRGLSAKEIQIFNILTGTAVWITVLLLGINLIGGKKIDMAKSKLVKANKKIANIVTTGYKKIEKGVVDRYKKIENGVVENYTKIEDKFVDAYLTKDGETVEEAKSRLKKENK